MRAREAFGKIKDGNVPLETRLQSAERWAAEMRERHVSESVAKYESDYEYFERAELYEKCEESPNLLRCYSNRVITRRFVSQQLALMSATINEKPQEPKLYARMLVEEIIAAKPSACALEATCREIWRSRNSLPSTAQVLKVLGKQMERWSEFSEIGEDALDYWHKKFDEAVVTLKQQQNNIAKFERERQNKPPPPPVLALPPPLDLDDDENDDDYDDPRQRADYDDDDDDEREED